MMNKGFVVEVDQCSEKSEQSTCYCTEEKEPACANVSLKIKNSYVRNFLAEFIGTFILVLIGDGAVAQWAMSEQTGANKGGTFLNVGLGYGLSLMIAICVAGGVSGAHLNPAVTLAMAVIKKLKWKSVPVYMAAQYLGAFFACFILWGNYADVIAMVSPADDRTISATAGIFSSYPTYGTDKVATYTLAMDQMLGTALLLIIVLATTDKQNMNINSSLVPVIIGLGLTALHLSFGLNAGSPINPARDLSPRLFTLMAGWEESFTAADSWFWIPWLLPHVGGVIGAVIYHVMISAHHPDL